MNPLTQIRSRIKQRREEVLNRIPESASYHSQYRASAYVYAGQLSFKLTEGDLLAIFSQYGEIVDVNLVRRGREGACRVQRAQERPPRPAEPRTTFSGLSCASWAPRQCACLVHAPKGHSHHACYTAPATHLWPLRTLCRVQRPHGGHARPPTLHSVPSPRTASSPRCSHRERAGTGTRTSRVALRSSRTTTSAAPTWRWTT